MLFSGCVGYQKCFLVSSGARAVMQFEGASSAEEAAATRKGTTWREGERPIRIGLGGRLQYEVEAGSSTMAAMPPPTSVFREGWSPEADEEEADEEEAEEEVCMNESMGGAVSSIASPLSAPRTAGVATPAAFSNGCAGSGGGSCGGGGGRDVPGEVLAAGCAEVGRAGRAGRSLLGVTCGFECDGRLPGGGGGTQRRPRGFFHSQGP